MDLHIFSEIWLISEDMATLTAALVRAEAAKVDGQARRRSTRSDTRGIEQANE